MLSKEELEKSVREALKDDLFCVQLLRAIFNDDRNMSDEPTPEEMKKGRHVPRGR